MWRKSVIIAIESRSNEKIKTAQKLASNGKFRKEKNEFFLEGLRLCSDAFESGVRVCQCFFTEKAREKYGERLERIIQGADNSYIISDDIADKLSETQSSQGVFAVCGMRENKGDVSEDGKYIALENIQDPANLGAVIRTAEALGLDGAILSGCCDCYNPKALRASMGSLLRLPLIFTDDAKGYLSGCMARGMTVLATTPDAAAERITELDLSGGVISVVGNEGNGVSEDVLKICRNVTIPMQGRAESLNASMAAAIVMWEMMR